MYALRQGLSFCVVDRIVVFLDTTGDRYFALSMSASQRFLGLIDALTTGAPLDAIDTHRFLDRRVLVETTATGPFPSSSIPLPRKQWDPPACPPRRASFHHLALAFASIVATQVRLRCRSFAVAIQPPRLKHRTARLVSPDLAAVVAFRSTLRAYPRRLDCLPVSLALRGYLASLGICSDLVIAVSMKPFAAHCWIQIEDMVIGDTLERIQGFTPILRVA